MKPMAYSKEYLSPCCYFVAISLAQKWRYHVKIIGGFCVNKYHWHLKTGMTCHKSAT